MLRIWQALVGRHDPLSRHPVDAFQAEQPSRLENWQILGLADEAGEPAVCVSGEIFGDPRFARGAFVTTSAVHGYRYENDEIVVVTRTGTEYLLGKPHVAETFAKSRLARYLDDRAGGGLGESHFVPAAVTASERHRARQRRKLFRH
jgi:hypothetical protein